MSCKRCGKTYHMDVPTTQTLVDQVAEGAGFRVDRSATVLYGVCRDCCAADPKTNVALLAEHSEDTLHAVKTSAPKEIYPHKSGRDGVAFLSDSFSWEDFATQMKRACALESVSGSVDISILQ